MCECLNVLVMESHYGENADVSIQSDTDACGWSMFVDCIQRPVSKSTLLSQHIKYSKAFRIIKYNYDHDLQQESKKNKMICNS